MRILYVEDNPELRETIGMLLEGEGHEVVSCASAEEALELVIRRMKEHKIRANRAHQRWMLARMRDIIETGNPALRLTLAREDYERTARVLRDQGFIGDIPDYGDFVMETAP